MSLDLFQAKPVPALAVTIYHCGACGVNLKAGHGFVECRNEKCRALNEVPEA